MYLKYNMFLTVLSKLSSSSLITCPQSRDDSLCHAFICATRSTSTTIRDMHGTSASTHVTRGTGASARALRSPAAPDHAVHGLDFTLHLDPPKVYQR
jgi:hypothetical protein